MIVINYKMIGDKNNERIVYIDALKTLSAMMIIIYHFSDIGFFDYNYVPNSLYLPGLGKILLGVCSVSVPLFFLINGRLTINRGYTGSQIFFKVLNIAKIYIIWGLIIVILFNLDDISIYNIINTFNNGLGWFWFLKTLALLYIFNYVYNRLPHKHLFGRIIFAILLIFPFLTNFYWVIISLINKKVDIPHWGITGFFTLYSIAYYLLPIILRYKIKRPFCIALIIIGLSLNTIEVYVYTNKYNELQDNVNALFPTIGTLFMTVGFWNLFRIIKYKYMHGMIIYLINWIGNNSLGIYILHAPLIFALHSVYPLTMSFIPGICCCLIILFVSAGLTSMIKSFKIGHYLLKI